MQTKQKITKQRKHITSKLLENVRSHTNNRKRRKQNNFFAKYRNKENTTKNQWISKKEKEFDGPEEDICDTFSRTAKGDENSLQWRGMTTKRQTIWSRKPG